MLQNFFFLVLKNLKNSKLRSWLTILGIFIGIAATVSLISLGGGLKEAMIGQFGVINSDSLTIQNKGTGFGPPGSTVVEKLNDRDLKIIESVDGILIVIPRLLRVVKFEYNEVSNFGYATSIPLEKEQIDEMYSILNMESSQGKLINSKERGEILIGSDIEKNSEDIFGKKIFVGKKVLIENKEFEVAGILKKMDSFQLNSVVFIPQEDLEEITGTKGKYDIIAARVKNKEDISIISSTISEKLRKDRGEKVGQESFSVETPIQAISSINTILNIVNLIVLGIAAISLLVGGIGIANTMYTSVLERTKEIGIMKAIGAKNSDILWIFLIESGLLGLVGGIIGVVLGMILSFSIAKLANLALGETIFRIQINYALIIGSVLFSFVVGILSGILPAYQASKLKVVEALRK